MVDQETHPEAEIRTKTEMMANNDLQKQGYFLIASRYQCKLKEVVLRTLNIDSPVVVIGIGTKAEFIDQVQRWNDLEPALLALTILDQYPYFYKVAAE